MPHPKYARAELCLGGAMLEEETGVAPQTGRVERIDHDHEHVDILWFERAGHERSKYHEPRQVTGRLSNPVDAGEAEGQRLSLGRSDAESVENLAQRCGMHPEG